MAYTASQRVSVVGIAGQFLGVRFAGRRIICSGIRTRCSGIYIWRYKNRSIVLQICVLFLNNINISNNKNI